MTGSEPRRRAFAALFALLVGAPAATAHAQGYGTDGGFRFVYDHDEGAGLVVGVRGYHLRYGPLRLTWRERVDGTARVSARGGAGVDARFQRRLSGTPAVVGVAGGAARRLRSYRFYGYGNDSPLVDSRRALVPLDEAWLEATLELPIGPATLEVGPSLLHLRPRPDERGPLARGAVLGAAPFAQVGVTSTLVLLLVDDVRFPRRGVALRSEASAYPALLDAPGAFGGSDLEVAGYLPLPLGAAAAVRVRGAFTAGEPPAHESAFLGGSGSLRGHAHQRFAGDAAVNGSVELRLPLFTVGIWSLGQLGALVFADSGRVYVQGESPGGWHRAEGMGLWVDVRRVTVTTLHAWGEERRLHLYLGMPF